MLDLTEFRKWLLHPALSAMVENGLEVAFEEGAGVLEVLFGVGFGGSDALKRLVQDANDPPLFGKRRENNREFSDVALMRCGVVAPLSRELTIV